MKIQEFQQIQSDLQLIINDIRSTIPFFATEGNCFLVADTKAKSEIFSKEFYELCKLNLEYNDIITLNNYIPSLSLSVKTLAALLKDSEINSTEVKRALANTKKENFYDPNKFLSEFTVIWQYLQKLQFTAYARYFGIYSWQLVPSILVQEDLATAGNDLDLLSEDIEIEFNPEQVKFLSDEYCQLLAKSISVHTEVQKKSEYLLEYLEFSDPNLEDFLIEILLEVFSQIYDFIYQQLNEVKLNLPELQKNLESNFGAVKEILINQLKNHEKNYYLSTSGNARAASSENFKSLIKIFDYIEETEIFDPANLPVFSVKPRAASSFELENFSPLSAVDIFEHPGKSADREIILASAVLKPAARVYELCIDLICGENNNFDFQQQSINRNNLTPWEEFLEKLKYSLAGQNNGLLRKVAQDKLVSVTI